MTNKYFKFEELSIKGSFFLKLLSKEKFRVSI